jgi:hypothetical protein
MDQWEGSLAMPSDEEELLFAASPEQQVSVGVVQELIRVKNHDLTVAAGMGRKREGNSANEGKEFGSALLGRIASLEADNETLNNRIEARNQEVEVLFRQLAECRTELAFSSQGALVSLDWQMPEDRNPQCTL